MYRRDTIAAIATPPGAGGIAIVRVSGPEALEVARRTFVGLPRVAVESHRLYVGRICEPSGEAVDQALCVYMRAPRSYTGEDVVELHCHGGPVVTKTVLGAALSAGSRPAERGEFTLRAFLNGKLDLVQAEAVADLIDARTGEGMRAAREQLEGRLSTVIDRLREDLLALAARLEAAIDFSDEGIAELDRAAWAAEAESVELRIRSLGETYRHGRRLRDGIRIAIVGKPNVGKSTLLNALVGEERVIVSEEPGTTRDVIEETIDVAGVPVVLVDTAGLRTTGERVESLGIERTWKEIGRADVNLVVLDGSRKRDADDGEILDATHNKSRILLINKADSMSDSFRHDFGPIDAPLISARDGTGIATVRAKIAQTVVEQPRTDQVLVTRERHANLLANAAQAIASAADATRAGNPPEVIAVDLNAALEHLGEVIGVATSEDVLSKLFSEFCIGK